MRFSVLTIISFCGLLVFAIGCGKKGGEGEQKTVQVTGTIKYDDGSPVANQIIQAEGPVVMSVSTDSDGKFKTEENNGMVPGQYRFLLEKTDVDMSKFEGQATLDADQKTLDVTLKRIQM